MRRKTAIKKSAKRVVPYIRDVYLIAVNKEGRMRNIFLAGYDAKGKPLEVEFNISPQWYDELLNIMVRSRREWSKNTFRTTSARKKVPKKRKVKK